MKSEMSGKNERNGERRVTRVVGLLLGGGLVAFFVLNDWSVALIAVATLALAFSPYLFAKRLGVQLPIPFLMLTSLFAFASIFLGEVLNFYERVWWWDLFLHLISGTGVGLIGFLLVFILFAGDRYAAPSYAICGMAFVFAVAIGTFWELLEYGMDQIFGTTMQKTGQDDTMSDLLMNTLGASLGALFGYFYLLGDRFGPPSRLIQEFVRKNGHLFSRSRNRPDRET